MPSTAPTDAKKDQPASPLSASPITFHYVEAEALPALRTKIIDAFITDIQQKAITVEPHREKEFCISAVTPDGKIAGALSGSSAWRELHVSLLAVNPDCQIKGTGTLLMREAERYARTNGCNRVALDTFSWQARPFYEKLGFQLIGTQQDYPHGHEKYFMEKVWPNEEGVSAMHGYDGAAEGLEVTEADPKQTKSLLHVWLNDNTQGRAIDGVPPYDREDYGIEAFYEDGSPAGFCAFRTWWNDLHVELLAAAPGRLCAGFGTAMIQRLKTVAKEKGCSQLSLTTMSWQAKPFYEKQGFREFGIQKNIPAGYDRHYLVCVLDA